MSEIEPITREELLLNSIAGEGSSEIEPITRQEHYLSAIAGESDLPDGMEPITREEIYYQKILDNGGAGGGGEATGTKKISISSNGTTSHNVKAYATAEVTVNVPNPSTGTKQITANGTHDVTDYASASVNVPNSYSASDEGKVVSNGELTAQTSRQVTANGTYDTTLNDSVEVNVPASGITPTGTKSITTNGDHDVTQYATAHVDVPTGITPSGSQTYTQNGTYDVTSLAEAVVNVASSGGRAKAEGTFTLASQSTPTIVHNLGTSKIAIVIFPVSEIEYTSGYANEAVVAVNFAKILEDEGITSFAFDYTRYNTHFTDVTNVALPDNNLISGGQNRSPWTSQGSWNAANTQLSTGAATITDTTASVGNFGIGTWKWIAWELD